MKKRVLFIAMIVTAIFISIGSISAADVDNMDSNTTEHISTVSLSDVDASVNELNQSQYSNGVSSSVEYSNDNSVSIEAPDVELYYKNGTRLEANLVDSNNNPISNQTIIFSINGLDYERVTDSQGTASIAINLNPGDYSVLVSYNGNGQYASSETTTSIKVLPVISGDNVIKYYQNGTQYYALFLDGHGNPLVNTTVTFNINGVFYERVTNGSGVARLNINLNPNTYILTAINPISGYMYSNNITVLPTIIANDLNKVYLDGNQYYALFLDNHGNPLINTTVTFNINGVFYERTTNGSGVARLNINLLPNTYILTAYNPNDGYAYSNTITVIGSSNTYIAVSNTTVIIGNNNTISAILYDQLGHTIPNQNIIITINGNQYTVTTDSNGVASLAIDLEENIYTVYYTFQGSGSYASSSNTSTLYVYDGIPVDVTVGDVIIYYNNNESFTLTLHDQDGNPLANKDVQFTINGVTYTRFTDANGVVSLKINLFPGSYDISYSFDDEYYQSISGNTTISVVETNITTITGSDVTFIQGSGNSFSVTLSAGNVPLKNQVVIFTINGVNYERVTDANGVARLNITLNANTYTITYSFNGNSKLKSSSGSSTITVVSPGSDYSASYGYWVQGRDMYNVDLSSLATQGTGNIFLNFYAFTLYGESEVLAWIQEANRYNIKVHIWMQAFYDSGWILPVTSTGSYNYDLFNQKIEEAKYYAGLSGVSGIHLDYLRFPGNAHNYPGATDAINEFVKLLTTAVREINPNIILSAAVMPETTYNSYYYGQDITVLSTYLDAIVPMVYKGNYNNDRNWISSVTQWFVRNSEGAQIWIGLQTYGSDSNQVPISTSELFADAQAAMDAGANGVVMFRFGLTNFINFNDLKSNITSNIGVSVSISDILETATGLKNHIENNGNLPSSVTVGDIKFSISQFLYLMSLALANIESGSFNSVISINVSNSINDEGDVVYGQIFSDEFLEIANSIVEYCINNNHAPDYITSSLGNIKYSTLVYMYSKILSYIDVNDVLPSFVYISNLLDNYSITVSMLPSASSDYQYIYYTTTWLNYCPNCGYYGTLLVNPKNSIEGELTCAYCDCDYCGVSGNIKVNNSSLSLTRLSSTVPSNIGNSSGNVSIDSILNASQALKEYIAENYELPDYIVIDGNSYTLAQFLYLMSTAIVNINNSNFGDIGVVDASEPANPSGNIINSNLSLSQYLDLAQRVANFILAHGIGPNYASSDLGQISYDELLDAFSRILAYYDSEGRLPATVQINTIGIQDPDNPLNSVNTISDLTPYLSATTNCQVNNAMIQELAASLTEGLTSDLDKATAIFNYVRDNISYQSYENTIKGAVTTLTSGRGNCCDQAHLLAALCRASDLPTRYVHGRECQFATGPLGHVWCQILIGDTWVVADPTSSRNSLGEVNNWSNHESFILMGYYATLPF